MLISLLLEGLPTPSGDSQYAIAAVVIMAIAGLRFVEAALARYFPNRSSAVATSTHHSDVSERDRERSRRIDQHVHELREWHKPDASGRQLWKNPDVAELLTEIRDILRDQRLEDRNRTRHSSRDGTGR